MKKLSFFTSILLGLTACFSCQSQQLPPSQEKDYKLADSIHFDHGIIDNLRKVTSSPFQRLVNVIEKYDARGNGTTTTLKPDGLEFAFEGPNPVETILSLKDSFKKRGYLVFRSSQNFGHEPDRIAVLRSSDQFDILKFKNTDGINYGITTDSVIARLREWNKRYPFEITGADHDWLEAQFIKTPADLDKFAQEVYRFCPDIVEQGTGTVKALAEEMKKTKTLYLWWD